MAQTQDAIAYQGAQLNIDHTPGAAVAAGELVQLGAGNFCGVANAAIAAGVQGAVDVAGVYKIKKGAIAFLQGVKWSWDDTLNTAVANGDAAEDWKGGITMQAAAAGDDFVLAKLNASPLV